MRPERRIVWSAARLVIELALATLAIWLVIQNAALLMLDPWRNTPPLLVVLGVLVKLGWLVIAAAWPWLVLAALGGAALAVAIAAPGRTRSEVRHG